MIDVTMTMTWSMCSREAVSASHKSGSVGELRAAAQPSLGRCRGLDMESTPPPLASIPRPPHDHPMTTPLRPLQRYTSRFTVHCCHPTSLRYGSSSSTPFKAARLTLSRCLPSRRFALCNLSCYHPLLSFLLPVHYGHCQVGCSLPSLWLLYPLPSLQERSRHVGRLTSPSHLTPLPPPAPRQRLPPPLPSVRVCAGGHRDETKAQRGGCQACLQRLH
jgi:hypothetical protein